MSVRTPDVFDVRPILAAGYHPRDQVLARVEALGPGGVLEVLAPFEPVPLIQLLRSQGCQVEVSAQEDGLFSLRIARGQLPAFEDLTCLEAPGPMERVLEACSGLGPGEVFTACLPQYPVLLVPHLASRGLEWKISARPDGTALLWVRCQAP